MMKIANKAKNGLKYFLRRGDSFEFKPLKSNDLVFICISGSNPDVVTNQSKQEELQQYLFSQPLPDKLLA